MRKRKSSKIIWNKIRVYIVSIILICCSVIAFNIHPTNTELNTSENQKMIFIFHDYEWNEYILNDTIHGSAGSWDYLFDEEVPDPIKWDEWTKEPVYTDSVSLSNNWKNNDQHKITDENTWDIKDNQVSIENIMSDLWIDSNSENGEDYLIINLSNEEDDDVWTSYSVKENNEDSSLIIEKDNPKNNDKSKENSDKIPENNDLLTAKSFSYIKDWRAIPVLVPWDELQIKEYNEYNYDFNSSNNSIWNWWYTVQKTNKKESDWVTIIDDYADCMTPRWYKIEHWDSVLAYKQLDNAPDICNIERRYCRNGKLSWTYTQQWCTVNKNYTYDLRWEAEVSQEQKEIKWWARQNPDWSVTVKNNEVWWSFVFDRPNRSSTEFWYSDDNIREESEWIDQTKRPERGCTTPRWEKVQHGQIIPAYKHANWFSDAPCESQIRLCSMWRLMWSFTESSCKTRDTSFIDWVNGSPTRKTYSKEKLERVKEQIKNEEIYYKNARKNPERSTDSDVLDKILFILDED